MCIDVGTLLRGHTTTTLRQYQKEQELKVTWRLSSHWIGSLTPHPMVEYEIVYTSISLRIGEWTLVNITDAETASPYILTLSLDTLGLAQASRADVIGCHSSEALRCFSLRLGRTLRSIGIIL